LIRTFFHLLSLLCLIAAIMTGTLDSIESVSSNAVVVTSLGNHWQNVDVVSLALAEQAVGNYIHPDLWRWALAPLLAQPAFAIFLALSLLFWMIGYRRPRFAGRFSA
jgi:predicted membrane protein